MVIGLIPRGTSMSWQGHLFGLIGGCAAAWALGSAAKPRSGQNAQHLTQAQSQQARDPELDQLLRDLDIE